MLPCSPSTAQYYKTDSKDYLFHLLKKEEESLVYLQLERMGHEP